MFQSMFTKHVIGPDSAAAAAASMDASNGKMPETLDKLQAMWRRHLDETTTWEAYFRRLGFHGDVGKPICADVDAWIKRLVAMIVCGDYSLAGQVCARGHSGTKRR